MTKLKVGLWIQERVSVSMDQLKPYCAESETVGSRSDKQTMIADAITSWINS